jgi:hypothetical protein
MTRFVAFVFAFAMLSLPAVAQQQRAPQRPQGQPPQRGQAQPAAPQEQGPALFPCRTAGEVCYLGIVIGDKVAVIYTNNPNAEGLEAGPIDVSTGEAPAGGGAAPGGSAERLDLRQHDGRVVMLTGDYRNKVLYKAELVEAASPLLSLVVKGLLLGQAEEPPPQAAPQRGQQGQPASRPRR